MMKVHNLIPMRPIRLLLLGLLPGCAVSMSMEDLSHSLRRAEVRTLAVEPGFTLVSPYDSARTADFARQIRCNLEAISRVMKVEFPREVTAYLEPLDVEDVEDGFADAELRIQGPWLPPTKHGVRGAAGKAVHGDGFIIVIYVPRDREDRLPSGRIVTGSFRFDHEPVIRHEIAHLCASLAGLTGPTWFDEALAQDIQYMELEDGRFHRRAYPATLAYAQLIHHEFRLEAVLDWEEQGELIAQGQAAVFDEGRPLAHSFLWFMLQRTPGDRLVDRYRNIHSLDRAELLALEDEWHRWLDSL